MYTMTVGLLVFCSFIEFAVPRHNQYSEYLPLQDVYHQQHIISFSAIGSTINCAAECEKADNCLSFSFNSRSKMCHLYSALSRCTEFSSSYQIQTNLSYYDLIAAERCPCTYNFQRDIDLCYRHYPQTGNNWSVCNQNCYNEGSYLIKVNTPERQKFVETFLGSFSSSQNIWIQGRKTNGVWLYDDGTLMTYFSWYTSDPNDPEPDNTATQIVIGILQSTDFQWNDRFTSQKDSGFICEIAAS